MSDIEKQIEKLRSELKDDCDIREQRAGAYESSKMLKEMSDIEKQIEKLRSATNS